MKLLNTITVCLFLSLAFMSCGDDDPAEEQVGTGLEGEWKATSFKLEATSKTIAAGIEIASSTEGTASNLDYTLILDDGDFTTSGAYDISVSVVITGMDPIQSNQSYTDVNGSGSYTTTDTEITVDGQLFDFEVDGMPVVNMTGPTSANYTISGDVLTFTQNDETTTTNSGVENVTILKSTSTWARQ